MQFIKRRVRDTAVETPESIFEPNYKLHGLPENTVSDCDTKFHSAAWWRLMEKSGMQLKISTSQHPETDAVSATMSHVVKNYLLRFYSYQQSNLEELLPSANLGHKCSVSDDIGVSLFEMDVGWRPRFPLSLISGIDIPSQRLDEFLSKFEASFEDTKYPYRALKTRQQAAQFVQKYMIPLMIPRGMILLREAGS